MMSSNPLPASTFPAIPTGDPSKLLGIVLGRNLYTYRKGEDCKRPPIIHSRYEMERTDFTKFITMPPNASRRTLHHEDGRTGYQVDKFGTDNKPYVNNATSVDFIRDFAPHTLPLKSDATNLMISGIVAQQIFGNTALIIDGGTGAGKSANALGFLFPCTHVYSFDSMEGLPVDWERPDGNFKKGTFAVKTVENQLPYPVYDNVIVNRGLLETVLPDFDQALQILPETDRQIALLHVDTDLHESAVTTLTYLGKYLAAGTVLVFDEFYNLAGFTTEGYVGEYGAFKKFIESTHRYFTPLTFNALHEQMTILLGEVNGDYRSFEDCNLRMKTTDIPNYSA